MKLLSVKILGDSFRSLQANTNYVFNSTHSSNRLSSKIFAGLNGSGKSNFLELVSEIFYFLEIYHLESVKSSIVTKGDFGFEIEYLKFTVWAGEMGNSLQQNANLVHAPQPGEKVLLRVRIVKPAGETPEFLYKLEPGGSFIREEQDTRRLLPEKIVAYTSGQNELISNPYLKLQYHYFKEFEKTKTTTSTHPFQRMFFLNYNTNFSIFIANLLLAESSKVNYLKNILQLNELEEFRITLNTGDLYRKVIPVNPDLEINLNYLKKCATTWIEKKTDRQNMLILDFKVTKATKEAFRFFFGSAFNLFRVFYELEIFNLYLVEKKTRDLMLTVHKSYHFADELPRSDPSRLVFRIEKIIVNKKIDQNGTVRNIYYKSLSDGEHQFAEVAGTMLLIEDDCLFLFDEPDTHFNPKWRSRLMQCLNFMSAVDVDASGCILAVRNQEVIITTHSPFVISDNHSTDVYCFEKKDGVVSFKNPDFKTYGASISIILDEIFDKKESISEMAKKELKEMVNGINTIEDLRKVVDRLNTEFGESAEKLDLFSELRAIKEQIEEKKP